MDVRMHVSSEWCARKGRRKTGTGLGRRGWSVVKDRLGWMYLWLTSYEEYFGGAGEHRKQANTGGSRSSNRLPLWL